MHYTVKSRPFIIFPKKNSPKIQSYTSAVIKNGVHHVIS